MALIAETVTPVAVLTINKTYQIMKTKKVQLKNTITEVPKHAVQITKPEDLNIGDYILIIWDIPKEKWAGGMEINSRLFTQVKKTIVVKGNKYYGMINHASNAKVTAQARQYNATYCGFGTAYLNEERLSKPFPHVIFKVEEGTLPNHNYNPPNLKGNPAFDLMM